MMFLLDTSEDLAVCASDLGVEPSQVGQLLTPLTRFSNRGGEFAIDNGAYSGFDAAGYRSLLKREWENRGRCLFVVAPDMVGSQSLTLDLWERWRKDLSGWPKVALVLQNGAEHHRLPWHEFDCLFVGGDDQFKGSAVARQHIRAAKMFGKWVHVGRVNTPERYRWCAELEVDSIDGSGISQYSSMRAALTGNGQVSLDLDLALESQFQVS
jgi:hypothetical protein